MKPTPPTAAVAASLLFVLAGAAAAQPPPPPPTADFVQAAAESDQFEMLEARLALVEGRDPRVRAFARQMIQDHMETSRTLRQAALQSGLPAPPTALSGDQAKLLGALQAQRGPEFDRTYARHQVLGHQQALVVEQGYAQGGSDAGVRQAAKSAVPVIQRHLAEARRMAEGLGAS